MNPADATPADSAGEEPANSKSGEEPAPAAAVPQMPTWTTTQGVGWLLRSAAWVAALAGIAGAILSPGVRGNASEASAAHWAAATAHSARSGASNAPRETRASAMTESSTGSCLGCRATASATSSAAGTRKIARASSP